MRKRATMMMVSLLVVVTVTMRTEASEDRIRAEDNMRVSGSIGLVEEEDTDGSGEESDEEDGDSTDGVSGRTGDDGKNSRSSGGSIPVTGDRGNLWVYVVCAGAALGTMMYISVRRRVRIRHENEEQ